jgi:hypothetical protein
MNTNDSMIAVALLLVFLAPAVQADAERGQQLWSQQFKVDGQTRSCTTCHGAGPREAGKHQRTGKTIEPMSPAVNPERLTDPKKMQKWFKRNCKWTLGRECTAQEQADVIDYLRNS